MTELFEFELTFAVPENSFDVELLSDAVFEAGVGDALVGTGNVGQLGVEIKMSGDDAEVVIVNAVRSLLQRLPENSRLHEIKPDLVSLADVADKLGVKRQSLQQRKMPIPVSGGLYRVDEVYKCLLDACEKKSSQRAPRFQIKTAQGWFMAGQAARKLNAKMTIGELDPMSW